MLFHFLLKFIFSPLIQRLCKSKLFLSFARFPCFWGDMPLLRPLAVETRPAFPAGMIGNLFQPFAHLALRYKKPGKRSIIMKRLIRFHVRIRSPVKFQFIPFHSKELSG